MKVTLNNGFITIDSQNLDDIYFCISEETAKILLVQLQKVLNQTPYTKHLENV